MFTPQDELEEEREYTSQLESEVATIQQWADRLVIELNGTLVCKDPGAGSVIISEMVGSKTLGWRRISSGHFRLACLLWMYLLVDVPMFPPQDELEEERQYTRQLESERANLNQTIDAFEDQQCNAAAEARRAER